MVHELLGAHCVELSTDAASKRKQTIFAESGKKEEKKIGPLLELMCFLLLLNQKNNATQIAI